MLLNSLSRWKQLGLFGSIFLLVNFSFYYNDREHVSSRLVYHKDLIFQMTSQRKPLQATPDEYRFTVDPANLTLTNGSRYQFLIGNTHLCDQTRPWLLIWVYSAIKNSAHRDVIRKTWGQLKEYLPAKVSVVFSLALPSTASDQRNIENEQRKYGDLVQDGTFIDDYKNLTYKAIGMLHWASAFCAEKKMLLKTDDDTLIIPYRLGRWLNEFQRSNTWPSNSMACSVDKNAKPERSINHKWYVSEQEFPEEIFGKTSCPTSYFISSDAIPKLEQAANKVRFLWLEDMFVSGVTASKANLSYMNISSHVIRTPKSRSVSIKRDLYLEPQFQDDFIIGHITNPNLLQSSWNIFSLLRRDENQCTKMQLPTQHCRAKPKNSQREVHRLFAKNGPLSTYRKPLSADHRN